MGKGKAERQRELWVPAADPPPPPGQPFYEQLKAIVKKQGTDKELEERLARAVGALQAAGAREVYPFGSACTDALRQGSDVDLAVAGLRPERFFQAMVDAADALSGSPELVDLDERSPFTRYLKEKGELERVGQAARADRRMS